MFTNDLKIGFPQINIIQNSILRSREFEKRASDIKLFTFAFRMFIYAVELYESMRYKLQVNTQIVSFSDASICFWLHTPNWELYNSTRWKQDAKWKSKLLHTSGGIYRVIKQMMVSYSKFMRTFEFVFSSPVVMHEGKAYRMDLQLFALNEANTSS